MRDMPDILSMNEEYFFYLLGFVKISKLRLKTLEAIGTGTLMPSEISSKTDMRTSQVSNALSDMKGKGLVVCINENVRKGRLYRCTPSGLEVLKYLEFN